MTAEAFRTAAVSLAGVVEGTHMGHPDFRVAQRIFASLGSPDEAWGMVKLPAEEQSRLLEAWPEMFKAAAGAWGRQGSTLVWLAQARTEIVARALDLAWTAAKAKPIRKARAKDRAMEYGPRRG